MDAMLEASGLSKSFGTVTAASDINVKVASGEIVGIVGANGAGKTVFVNMITGYEKPTSGRILFQGRDITALPPRQITNLGICRSFQVSQIFLTMTVFENLLLAIAINRNAGFGMLGVIRRPQLVAEVEQVLDRFSLQAHRDRPAQHLAQGVRKLVDIAMAVVARPKVLMLDEPTSGISTEEKFDFMKVVMDALSAEKVAVFIVEHDMEIIQRFVSRVLAFSQGRIICDASPQEALRDPEVIEHVLGSERYRTH